MKKSEKKNRTLQVLVLCRNKELRRKTQFRLTSSSNARRFSKSTIYAVKNFIQRIKAKIYTNGNNKNVCRKGFGEYGI